MTTTVRAGSQLSFVPSASAADATGRGRAGLGNLGALEPGALGDWVDLLARISHDLRTPLNAVIGFSDAMQNELFGPLGHSRYQEYARHIRTSGDLLLKAAEDTLAMTALLAAPNAVTLGDIRLADALREALEAIEAEAMQRGIRIETDIDADVMVRGDGRIMPRALRQMLAAELAKAPPRSHITIATTGTNDRVVLRVAAGLGGDDVGTRQLPSTARTAERGLGRDELPIWHARMLLELQHCEVRTESGADHLVIVASFENALQPDFFARRS